MWDDAVLTSVKSGKPTVAFDLDLIDSASIHLANVVIRDAHLQAYLRSHFETAMNDFASDPPPTVGLDSLRNLGWRLSGLEKDYHIGKRPCVIVIGTNKQEIDRIVFPATLTAKQLERQLDDILHGRNTLQSAINAFWQDSSKVASRSKLIDLFEQRGKYDSVIYHLESLRRDTIHRVDAQNAWGRYAYLRLHVEGNVRPINDLMVTLGKQDSAIHFAMIQEVLDHYKKRKKPDSVAVTYEKMMTFMGRRDPNVLNDYAWYLAKDTHERVHALAIANEAVAKQPDDPNFLDTRALAEGNLDKFDDAIRDEEAALKIAPTEDKSYFNTQLRHYRDLKKQSLAEPEEDTLPKKH